MKIRADLIRKPKRLRPAWCQVEKVVEVSGPDFNAFLTAPQEAWPFIGDNAELMHQWNGVDHCLLVLAEGRTDGVLVNSDGSDHALCAAYLPRARAIVDAELDRVADYVISRSPRQTASQGWRIYCEELDEKFGVIIQEGNGLDTMLQGTLERRPEVAQAEISLQHIDMTFHPEFCRELHGGAEEKKAGICIRDILPLLTDSDLTFFYHPEEEAPVLAEHLKRLTDTGREDYAALLNARVVEINRCAMGTGVTITDVDPEELVRFNRALDAFEAAEQAAGPVM